MDTNSGLTRKLEKYTDSHEAITGCIVKENPSSHFELLIRISSEVSSFATAVLTSVFSGFICLHQGSMICPFSSIPVV